MKFPFGFQVLPTIFIIALAGITNSKIPSEDRNEQETDWDDFRCGSGEIIWRQLVCNGRADCPDQSDETHEECNRFENPCPELAFRCNYGACIDDMYTCNGIDDCVDGSDELLPKCNDTTFAPLCESNEFRCNIGQCVPMNKVCDGNYDCYDNTDETHSSCRELDFFRCINGQIIWRVFLCDGQIHCLDRSDETREECRRPSSSCPSTSYTCNYGACVHKKSVCNGIEDCADNSDELLHNCNSTNRGWCHGDDEFKCNISQCISINKVCDGTFDCFDRSDEINAVCSAVKPRAGVRKLPRPPQQSCELPSQPENGRLLLHAKHCPNNKHCDIPSDTLVLHSGARLIYICNDGYKIDGSADILCDFEGEWSHETTCIEIRCKALNSASTNAKCTHKNQWISCELPVPVETTAIVSCQNSYHMDLTVLSAESNKVKCNSSGQWHPPPTTCIPDCGQISLRTNPLIAEGQTPDVFEFPWHATLYRVDTVNGTKEFRCGATIIGSDLLITAAHCVFDESTKTVQDATKFYIATGNLFQDYDSTWHNPNIVKKAKVQQIFVPCEYLGFDGNYAQDIAILHIEQPFIFSSTLKPVCLDKLGIDGGFALDVGSFGKVAGFGRTAGNISSTFLQSLVVPYVSLHECRNSSSDPQSHKFLTYDKFCAGYRNGSSVCDGDSGGGLVVETYGLWFLRGLVSVGVGVKFSGGSRNCDSYAYSLYTKISSHIEWIQEIKGKIENHESSCLCPDKCSKGGSSS